MSTLRCRLDDSPLLSAAVRGPTERLALAAASVPDDVSTARVDEALASAIDWSCLVRLAEDHRLAPLLARRLADRPLDEVGDRARAELIEAARRSLYGNLLLAGELPKLLDRFAAAGIPALVFKGPTLAAAAYGSLELRPFDDLDLAVRERDFEPAKRVLLAAGLTPSDDEFAAVRHLSNEQAFEARGGRLQVDLHGRLLPRELFPVDFELLLTRAVRVRVGAREAPTLRPEDLFVVHCEHAHKHFWVRLVWLADLARLASSGLDWEAVEELAHASGSRRVVGIGALLAAELLGAPLPSGVADRARADGPAVALAEEIASRLFAPSPAERAQRQLVSLQWRSRNRWRDRLRYLWTPNESDWMICPLPVRWEPVYRVVRPLRLLLTYGPWRAASRAGKGDGAGATGPRVDAP